MQRALLISLVALSYLLFAGGPRWTLGPLLLLATAGVLVEPARTLRFPAPWRRLDAALAVIVLGILIQLIPLPRAVLAVVSPHTLEVRRALRFAPLGSPEPGWASVTLNPEATAYALGTVVLGILSLWIARALFAAGGSSRKFCRALAVFGAAAALAAMVQKVVAPTLVLGILQPDARSTNPLGAFTNRNHFAAWLLMIATVACGYLIAHLRIHPFQRGRALITQVLSSGALPAAGAAIITIGVLVITLSRSAVAGLGAAAMAGWVMGRPRMQIERTSLPAIFGTAGAVILIFVMFVDVDAWAARFEQSLAPGVGFSRIGIWKETVPIIADFPLAGTGAGTYSDAMTHYQQTRFWVGSMQRWAHFNNAHSQYVQVAAEGGLLLTVPALCALVFLWSLGRRALRGDKGEMFWARVGAGAGLVGLAVQSIWEVALTMPANAVLAGVLAGLLIYKRKPSAEPSSTGDLQAQGRERTA